MGRLIDEEEFKENLIKCKGLGRKSLELVCEALNNTSTAGDEDWFIKFCCHCVWYGLTSDTCLNEHCEYAGKHRESYDSCEKWKELK